MRALSTQSRYPPLLLLAVGLLPAALGCTVASGDSDGTRSMVERLRAITERTDPGRNPFMNTGRVALLEAALTKQGGTAPPPLLLEYAAQLLNAGRTGDAIAQLDRIEEMMRARRLGPRSQPWVDLRLRQAVANLRRAEDENCVEHHNARSCLFPIKAAGVHMRPRGSQAAVAILTELLEWNPDDLRARWLLNIAAMTLGDWPDKVPPRWLLAPEPFQSDDDIKPFPDIAGDLGVDVDDLAGGSIVEDFDGDGYLDIMASAMGLRSQLRYFRNNTDGTFSERTSEAGLVGETGGLNIVQTDYDNDGAPDVLVLRGAWMGAAGRYPNSLLRNNGDGTFIDVTEEAGLLSFHPTQTAAWFDADGDGWLDLFIGNESTDGDPHPCELYRNNGDGTFSETAESAGVAVVAFVKGVTSGDYDNDGRPDLYLSIRGMPNRLYHNDGAAGREGSAGRRMTGGAIAAAGAGAGAGAGAVHFTDVARAAGVTEPLVSFPTWFWDYDNDGWEDLFVSGYLMESIGDLTADILGMPHQAELPRLYHNNHDGTFEDVTRAARLGRLLLAMGSNYGDLDNDGWLDFYVGTGNPDLGTLLPDRAFRNAGGRFFQDVTTSGGFGHLQKGHGVSFADLDNDGDQDIYHVVGGAVEADHFRNALFENPGHGNHWVAIRVVGVASNRAGIGARIRVVVETPEGERSIYKTVRSGGSFGASPLRQEIGLGAASRILRLEIAWPATGRTQVVRDLEMDRHYVVREGEDRAVPTPLRSFRLGGTAHNGGA